MSESVRNVQWIESGSFTFNLQVCYLEHARCFRSDDRCLLLLSCPQGFVCVCPDAVYGLRRLVLSGDVELSPAPLNLLPENVEIMMGMLRDP